LGIASLGSSWHLAVPSFAAAQYVSAIIASLLLALLVIKFLGSPSYLIADLKHPVVGSVLPTFAMASMVVSTSLSAISPSLAVVVWLVAIALHTLFLVVFIAHRSRSFKLADMVPSWFVPPVGIIVAAITYPSAHYHVLAEIILWFGISCYVVLLPIMVYRLWCCGALPDNAKPTVVVMAAPASVCLAGYLTSVTVPAISIVWVLVLLAVLKTSVIYRAAPRLKRLPFSPGISAFTFPLVIGATALFKVQCQFTAWQLNPWVIEAVGALAVLELLTATTVVAYVVWCYLGCFKRFWAGYAAERVHLSNRSDADVS